MNKNHDKKGLFARGDGDGDGETGEHQKKVIAEQLAGAARGEIQHNWFEERQAAAEKDRADRAALYNAKVEAQSPESQLSDHIAAHREATGSSYATARKAALKHMGRRDLPTGRTPRLNQPTVEVQDEKGVRHTIRMHGSYQDRSDALRSLSIGYPKMKVVRFHGD